MSDESSLPKPGADMTELKPVELTNDLVEMSAEEREARRKALKHMLTSNEQRQQAALRKRQPSMTLGDRIAIVDGELHGKQAKILDADFIHSRALLKIDEIAVPQWLPFKNIVST